MSDLSHVPPRNQEAADLGRVARLLAMLLLRELDSETLARLSDPSLRPALTAVGIELPGPDDLEDLAAEYFACFIHPQGGTPLVQSLLDGGAYEGEAARGTRAVAEAAGLELNQAPLRGAPVDHFAVQLFLWSELIVRDADAAEEFARRHLRWAEPLLRAQRRPGFYGSLCGVASEFLAAVTHAPSDRAE